MTETASTNNTADFFKPYELNPNFPNLAGANRMERAHEILKGKKAVKKVAKNTFAVKSQMGVSTYTVSRNGDAYTCNCPDCIVHGAGWECKHIMAVKEFLNESITTATPKKNTQRNWTGYTLGQVNEEELVKIFLRQLCDTVESPAREAGKAGRKAIPLSELVFCSVMKVYSKKSSRRAHTALRDASEQNLLEYAPNYNAVNKFMVREDVTPILHHLVRLSALPLAELETSFSIDSSGFATTQFGEWCDNKHGKAYVPKSKKGKQDEIKANRKHTFLKCHISAGNRTNVVADVVITEAEGEGTSDVNNFKNLLDGTNGYFNVLEVMADAAYGSRDNYAKADELGVTPYILFKKNMTSSAKGCGLWRQMYMKFLDNPREYMEHYEQRNNVESTFGAIKAKMGEKLMAKTLVAQKNELLCKILAYNLTVLAESFFIDDIEVNF